MAYTIKVSTAPASDPVTLGEAKNHLRLDGSADDALIGNLITAATRQVEQHLGRALITQTLVLHADHFPRKNGREWWSGVRDGAITELHAPQRFLEVPRPPLQSVTSVKYWDTSDSINTFASSNYVVDSDNEPGRVILKTGQAWPSDVRAIKAVEVTYVAGYGTDWTDVPEAIRQALLRVVSGLYNRECEDCLNDPITKALLGPWRVWHL